MDIKNNIIKNTVIQTAIAGTISGIVARTIENEISSTVNITKRNLLNKLGFTISYNNSEVDGYRMDRLNSYIYNLDKDKYAKYCDRPNDIIINRKCALEYNMNNEPCNNIDIPTLSKNISYTIKLKNNTYIKVSTKGNPDKSNKSDTGAARYAYCTPGYCISVFIYGKKSYGVYKRIINFINYKYKSDYMITGFNDERGRGIVNVLEKRKNLSTVFIEDNVDRYIIDSIKSWKRDRKFQASIGQKFKLCILLKGEPGTGKTSLIKALCSELDCCCLYVSMAGAQANGVPLEYVNRVETLIKESETLHSNNDHNPTFIVLEDLDRYIGIDERDSDKDKSMKKAATGRLMQLLDGMQTPDNVIFVLTTNHKNSLDSDLLRCGRIDYEFEIGYIRKETAVKMINMYKLDPEYIFNKYGQVLFDQSKGGRIQPAKLSYILRKERNNLFIPGGIDILPDMIPVEE